ncbi:leucine-rich repeat domain-containing protein [Synechococcus sp. AH-551-A21]|nr:leucine-rich repeat domain-containing protein [Synechococcus sp. AH-551-A21]MDB4678042.1 leucine-rich repeat domain-containing protein [Synechococcus sp. AH-551-A21]
MTIIAAVEASRYDSQIEKALWLADYLNDAERQNKGIQVTREIAEVLFDIQGANITIPDGVQSIEWGAFQGMNIESVVISDGVTRIGHEAFEGTQLKSVVIPKTVDSVGKGAFAEISTLESVIIEGNPVLQEHSFHRTPLTFITGRYSDEEGHGNHNPGIVFVEDGVLRREHIEKYFEIRNSDLARFAVGDLFKSSNSPGLSFDIPEGVEHIAANAFAGMSVENVTLPDSLKTIGHSAFAGSQISEVVIPNSVSDIGEGAFAGTPLVSVDIGEGVRSIGDYAFAGTQITNIELPGSLESIGEGAFTGTSLENIEVPENVIEVGSNAFPEPVLPDPVFEVYDSLTGSEPTQFEGARETFDPLTNPNPISEGTVSEFIEPDPFALSGGEGMVIETIDGLQGFSTDLSSESNEEQLQADLFNSMAAPSEVLA